MKNQLTITLITILFCLNSCEKDSKNNKDFAIGKYTGIINVQINKLPTTTNTRDPSYGKNIIESFTQIMEVNITDSNNIIYINGFPMAGGPNTYNLTSSTNSKTLPDGIYLLNKNERKIDYSYTYKGKEWVPIAGTGSSFEYEVSATKSGTLK